MHLIAATPGTYKINEHGHVVSPIVGWLYVTGTRADPVFAAGQVANVGAGDGIIFGASVKGTSIVTCAGVLDVATGTWFLDTETWRARPKPAKTKPKAAEDEPDMGAVSQDEVDGAFRPLNFGPSIGKRKSYWIWPAAEAVFVVDINQKLPDDPRVEKSTGKEFAEWVEKGWSIIDPATGEEIRVDEEPEKEPEPEAPAADDDDEDDDGMNMV